MAVQASKQDIPANLVADLTDPLAVEEADVTVEIEGTGAAEAETGGEKEADNSGDDGAGAAAIEEEARKTGWVSEDEWKDEHGGGTRGWKPAADYLEFRAGMLPIQLRENKELRAKVDRMEKERAEEKRQNEENRSRYERESLKAQLKQARDDNDWDKVDEISDKLLDLKVTEKAAPAAKAATAIDPDVQRDFNLFSSQNPWLKPGTRLGKLFAAQLESVMKAGAADGPLDAMETAKKMTKALFPEEFPSARKVPMAETRGENGHSGATTRSWSQLKADVKENYEPFLKSNPKVTKEMLLKDFPAEYFRSN